MPDIFASYCFNCPNWSKTNCAKINNKLIPSQESEKESKDPKNHLLEKISYYLKKNITIINTLFLKSNQHFGNNLISLSNAIFYCEILKCKEIIIDSSLVFIKNPIYYEKFNMTIKLNNNTDCTKIGVVCL